MFKFDKFNDAIEIIFLVEFCLFNTYCNYYIK